MCACVCMIKSHDVPVSNRIFPLCHVTERTRPSAHTNCCVNTSHAPSPRQVQFSRSASPHVNFRLDSRPVSSSVALLDAERSGGALLVATGNKVSTTHTPQRASRGSFHSSEGNRLFLFFTQITKIPLIGPGCSQLTSCTSCLLSARVTECGWCDGHCTRAQQCPTSSGWTQDYCPPVITKVTKVILDVC